MATRLESFVDFATLPKSYFQLLNDHAATFDQTAEWFSTFAQYLLDRDELLLLGVADADSGRALGLLPMRRRQQRLGPFPVATLESLANYYSACFAPVIAADADQEMVARSLIAAVASRRREWSQFDLTPMAPDHPMFRASDALREHGCRVQRYFRFGNWYLEVGGRDFGAYLQSMPSRMRSTLTRKSKKLMARTDVALEIVTAPEQVDAAMDAYERVYAKSWKHDEPHKDFIRAIAKRFAAAGWLRLGVARVGDQVAAAQLWFTFRDTANIFKLAYDPDFTDLSVGSVLTMHLMRHAIDADKVAVVDYLCGDDAYKKDWMSHRRERWAVRANPWFSIAGVSEAARGFAGRMRRRAARSETSVALPTAGQSVA